MAERLLTLYLPVYDQAIHFLRVLHGRRHETLEQMWRDILSHVGNPQDQVNWSDPCAWIPERLCGDSEDLATLIWRESKQSVNPRWSRDLWRFVDPHSLIEVNDGVCALTELGRRFVDAEDAAIRQVDEREGMYLVLSEVADKGSSRLNDLIDGFRIYCHLHTNWKSETTICSALLYRLNNFRYRELVVRSGHAYEITEKGIRHLRTAKRGQNKGAPIIEELARDSQQRARNELLAHLRSMDPYQFEHLVKRLLVEMGYDNVEVPGGSNDKGVDVVADIELGISRVREVIQVKRWKDNVNRPVLDQLRGSLHYFQAVRGTIITTGGFTKGTKEAAFLPGAAPITLIDGETLLDLLIANNIGIKKREIRILEFDADSLSEFETEEDSLSEQVESE